MTMMHYPPAASPRLAKFVRMLDAFEPDDIGAMVDLLIERLDARDGDPDLEETDAEDSFALPRYALEFASGPGCKASDEGELVGDEHDYSGVEDEPGLVPYGINGPGCPISDPDGGGTVGIVGGEPDEDAEPDEPKARLPHRDRIRRTRCTVVALPGYRGAPDNQYRLRRLAHP